METIDGDPEIPERPAELKASVGEIMDALSDGERDALPDRYKEEMELSGLNQDGHKNP